MSATLNHETHGGSLKSYITGFILSIVLTLAAYFVATTTTFSVKTNYILLFVFALLQLLVQLVCFLHVTEGSRWNLTSLAFTLLTTIILLVGSLWVMYNLNVNMMGM